jgi:hypothetical protein
LLSDSVKKRVQYSPTPERLLSSRDEPEKRRAKEKKREKKEPGESTGDIFPSDSSPHAPSPPVSPSGRMKKAASAGLLSVSSQSSSRRASPKRPTVYSLSLYLSLRFPPPPPPLLCLICL